MAFAIAKFTGLESPRDFKGLPNQIAANLASGGPSQYLGSQADLAVATSATTSSSIFDCGSALSAFKSQVWIKTSTIATEALTVKLQVSSSATFASDVVNLDVKAVPVPVTGQLYSFTLQGAVSDVARQYIRLQFTVTTGAGVADIIVAAV